MHELGVEPGTQLQELHRGVLAHDPELDGVRRRRPPITPAEARERRRRGWMLAALAALILAAVAAAAVLVVRGGGSGPVVVLPDAVAVIDAGSSEVVQAIPVGSSPGPIDIEGGTAWVVNRNDATVNQIDVESREVVGATGFSGGNSPRLAVLDDGRSAWLGTVETTDKARRAPGAGEVTTLNIGDPTVSGVVALALLGDALLVADEGGALLGAVDYISPRIVSRIELEREPVALAVGAGERAWVANQGRTVSRVDLATEAVAEAQVGARPTAVAVGEDAVWVANGSDGTLSRLSTDSLTVTATITVGRDPTALAVGEGAVWVANGLDGTVSSIDPETNEVVATIEVGHRPQGVAVADGLVWVTVRA